MSNLQLHIVLKRLMAQHRVGVRALARATDVPQATISSYLEGGGSSKPTHIRAISKYFKVSMEKLLFDEDADEAEIESLPLDKLFEGWLKVKIERVIRKDKSVKR